MELSRADHSHVPPRIDIPRRYNAAHDLFERSLQAGRGGKTAYIDDRGRYTYAELATRVNRAANALLALGIVPEQRVLLALHDTIDFPTVFLGAIKAGIVPIAANTLLTAKDYRYILDDSRAVALIVSPPLVAAFELARLLPAHGDVTALDRTQLELENAEAIRATVRALRPALIVNAAAYTAVDRAEQEPEQAEAINAHAPGVLAEEAKRLGALLIHYSTDYVFDGAATEAYREDAPTNPINAYGRSKLHGEQAVLASGAPCLVLRTSWVYGLRGQNFLLTIRRLASEREELRIVADQVGVPNWSHALAESTSALVGKGLGVLIERSGLYHMSARGSASWFEFARAIIGSVDKPRVVPITTAEYPTPARRPLRSVLATAKFERVFGLSLADWRSTLERCLATGA